MTLIVETLEHRTLFSAIQPDVTFGADGIAPLPFLGRAAMVREVADGNVLSVGVTDVDGIDHLSLARHTAGGQVDNTFGTKGVVATEIQGTPIAATVQGGGKVLIL